MTDKFYGITRISDVSIKIQAGSNGNVFFIIGIYGKHEYFFKILNRKHHIFLGFMAPVSLTNHTPL